MADNLYPSVPGVPYAPVAAALQAGIRSLISGQHGHVPPRLGRWAIPVRLCPAAACFAGGFVCARLFVECLLGDTRMCPCVLPTAPFSVALVLGLVVLCAASFLTLAKPGLTAPRALLGQALLPPTPLQAAYRPGVSHG